MTWLADHWLDVLGWSGSALLIYSLMQARVLRFRVLNLVACVVLVVFNAVLEIWPMVAMNVVLSGINLYFIRKLVADRHDERAFEVLEVGPTDEYLRYVLRVHAKDILAHQPGLVWDGAAPGRRAYLVQHANETVGVVLARKGQSDLAVSVVKNSVAQIAAFLFPVLILVSLLFATHLTFALAPVYVVALGLSALLVWQVTGDGEAAEFEGWALVAVYVIVAVIALYE